MIDTPVYIVFRMLKGSILTIESVWSTRALAQSARALHAHNANCSVDEYYIARREVNTASNKQKVQEWRNNKKDNEPNVS